MKTSVTDPWSNRGDPSNDDHEEGFNNARFEDSFVSENMDPSRLSDSEQYLARLYSRLKHAKGGTSKKDLVNSLSDAKADCIARLVMNSRHCETEKEALLVANPVIRHIAPHLQALTAGELVHLLKADVLQSVTNEQIGHEDRTNVRTDKLAEEPPTNGQSKLEKISLRPEKLDNADRDAPETIHND